MQPVVVVARFEEPQPELFEERAEPVWELEEPDIEDELAELEVVEALWDAVDAIEPDAEFEYLFPEPAFDFEWPSGAWDLRLPNRAPEPVPNELVREPVEEAQEGSERSESSQTIADADPFLLEANPPSYPALARRRRWEGTVLCRISVGEDGSVIDVTVEESTGYSVLDDAAVKAVRTWRFQPGIRLGTATAIEVLHKVTFRLVP